MKKFLAIVSLVLVFVMLASMPSFAEGYEYTWEDPKGVPKYYASDISGKAAPVIDGEIKEGEYGDVLVVTDNYFTMAGKYPEVGYQIDDSRVDQPASEKFEYYFSYDNENIYIAFKDYGAKWDADSPTAQYLDNLEGVTDGYLNFAARSNYYIYLGFMLDDMTNRFCLGCSSRGFDESRIFDMGTASPYVPIGDLVEELYMRKYMVADGTVFAKCDVNGSLVTDVKGNTNQYDGQFIAECEIKLSKAHIVELLNENHFTEFTELGNACWISITNRAYVAKKDGSATYSEPVTAYNEYFRYDIRGKKADYVNYGVLEGDNYQAIPSLLVFAPEGTPIELCKEVTEDTTPAATEPAATTPAATEPAATTPAGDDPVTTEPAGNDPVATEPAGDDTPDTEPAKEGGCGGAVSFAGLALVAALGTCTVFVAKKKED